jgi:hypothetical protein
MFAASVCGQVLEFESGGLKYQALTKGGVTVMVAPLPTRILGYSIVQVAVSNGAPEPVLIQPDKFQFLRSTGAPIKALSARTVVSDVMNRAGHDDVGRLIAVYEAALYGNSQLQLKFGYEARRKDAMAIGNSRKSAGAAAAAIVLGSRELLPGATVDGAVFLPTANRPLGAGKLVFEAENQNFEFTIVPPPTPAR